MKKTNDFAARMQAAREAKTGKKSAVKKVVAKAVAKKAVAQIAIKPKVAIKAAPKSKKPQKVSKGFNEKRYEDARKKVFNL